MPLANGRSTPGSFQQRQVPRGGAGKEQADFDILTDEGAAYDLDSRGEFRIPEDADLLVPPDIGGLQRLALAVESQDNATFTITVSWLDEDANVLYEQSPGSVSNTTNVFGNFVVKGDRFGLTITDTSGGTNRVTGTVNVH